LLCCVEVRQLTSLYILKFKRHPFYVHVYDETRLEKKYIGNGVTRIWTYVDYVMKVAPMGAIKC